MNADLVGQHGLAELENSAAEAKYKPEKLPSECEDRGFGQIFSWLSNTLIAEGAQSWGRVLDARSGLTSMCWLLRQKYHNISAVTATASDRNCGDDMQRAVSSVGASATVLVGNWNDKQLQFDIVVADYLLGALDRFWAFAEDEMMAHLLQSIRLEGFLLVVGMEPYEQVLDPENAEDALVLEVEALGNVATVLAGHRSYRELPRDWVVRQIARSGQFHLVATQEFPTTLRGKFVSAQLEFAQSETTTIADAGMQQALLAKLERLREAGRSFKWNGTGRGKGRWRPHKHAKDYAIIVQRISLQ